MRLWSFLVDRPRDDRRVVDVDQILLGQPLQQLGRFAGTFSGVELPNGQCCAHGHSLFGCARLRDPMTRSTSAISRHPSRVKALRRQASARVAVTQVAAPTTNASNNATRLKPSTARTIPPNNTAPTMTRSDCIQWRRNKEKATARTARITMKPANRINP